MSFLPRLRNKTLLPIFSTLVIFLSIFAGVILVQQQQELRERAQSSIPAFPGAEGFGAQSIGGRGGKVFEVTNLNDSGPGSLRACVEASGPRICVFRTGGTIEVNTRLHITNSFITIAGQTAPGGGIALKRSSGTSGSFFDIAQGTHDVIIRYIRVRPGTFGGQPDGIGIYGSNVIIDHSSVSWAVDENMSTNGYDAKNVTIQWSIISEGLYRSTHPDGPHSMGLLLGQSPKVSVHHSLLAHNHQRNPRITKGDIDFVNNVIYNWGSAAGHADNQQGPVRMNYIGNYIKPGPDSRISRSGMKLSDSSHSVYVEGNIGEHSRPSNDLPEWDVIDGSESFRSFSRHSFLQVTTTSAFEAFNQVLAKAGATLPVRDSVDQRIVNDVKNGTGRIIDSPSEVGGWPSLASGTPPADSDHDGMADNWEISQFGNLSRNGTADANGNGYTDLEEYLNSLAGAVPPPPPPPSTPTPTKKPTVTPTPTKPPIPTPTFPPPSGFTLLSEAEEMTLVSPMTLGTGDANALSSKYISPTSGSNSTSPTAEATLNFTLPTTGAYYLWARIMGPDGGSDALYIGVDGSFDRVFPSGVGFYEWVRVETGNGSGNYSFSLSGGTHTYQVGHGELNARLDALYVTDDPNYIPTFAPDGTPTSTPTTTPLPGDINGDGIINILDFQILNNNFGTSNTDSDLNGDGVVNILDFQILSNNFGKTNG